MTPALKDTELNNQKWTHIAIIAFLALLLVCLFHEWANPDKMLIASDRIAEYGPRSIMQKGLLKDGQIVQWNRGVLGGMPTGDAMAGDYLLPITFPFNYLMPPYRGQAGKLILHLFLGGLFFYLMLLKAFKIPMLLAGAGAVFFMLNPSFLSLVSPGHDAKMGVIALLPLMVWIVKSGLDKPDLKKVAFLGIAIGLSLLTVHVQMVYFSLWVIGAVWLFNGIFLLKEKNYKLLRNTALFFWGGVFLGLLLGAPQFLVSMMFIQDAHSVRGNIDFEKATSWSMHFAEMTSLWVAEFCGYHYYWGENAFKLNTEYIGAAAMILAVLALVFKPSKWRIFWLALAIFVLLLSLSADSPGIRYGDKPQDVFSLYMLAYKFVPGIDKFRAMSMITYIASFAIVLLSVFSLKDIYGEEWKNFSTKRLKNTKTGLLISIALISLIALIFADKNFNYGFCNAFSSDLESKKQIWEANFTQKFRPALGIWWIIASCITVSIWAVMGGYLKKQTAIIIIFALGTVDLLRVGTQYIRFESNAMYKKTPPAVAQVLQKTKNEPSRTLVLPDLLRALGNENIESYWGLESVNGFHDNELSRYREFRGRGGSNYFNGIYTLDQFANGTNTLNLANCRYIFYQSGRGISYIENKNALPRLSFTDDYIVESDREKISQMINEPEFPVQKIAILEQKPSFSPSDDDSVNTKISVKWHKYTANYRVAEVEVEKTGLLRISEVYYPAWQVFVNGEKAQILNSDIAFMAVEIPAGKHKIEMKIDSLYLKTAALVSLPGYIFLMFVFAWGLFLKRRKK